MSLVGRDGMGLIDNRKKKSDRWNTDGISTAKQEKDEEKGTNILTG